MVMGNVLRGEDDWGRHDPRRIENRDQLGVRIIWAVFGTMLGLLIYMAATAKPVDDGTVRTEGQVTTPSTSTPVIYEP